MKRQVVDCDRCGVSDLKEPITLRLVVGEQKDPVDCRTRDVMEQVELCPGCAEAAIAFLLHRMAPNHGGDEEFHRWVQNRKVTK